MKTVVSEKGQITLPKALRDRLGLYPGVVLEFEDREGRLIGRKAMAEDPIQQWRGRGHLPGARTVDTYLKRIRDGIGR